MILQLFSFLLFHFPLFVCATDVLPVDIWADISERLELIDRIVLSQTHSTAQFAVRETSAAYKDLIKECGSEGVRLAFPSFAPFYSNFQSDLERKESLYQSSRFWDSTSLNLLRLEHCWEYLARDAQFSLFRGIKTVEIEFITPFRSPEQVHFRGKVYTSNRQALQTVIDKVRDLPDLERVIIRDRPDSLFNYTAITSIPTLKELNLVVKVDPHAHSYPAWRLRFSRNSPIRSLKLDHNLELATTEFPRIQISSLISNFPYLESLDVSRFVIFGADMARWPTLVPKLKSFTGIASNSIALNINRYPNLNEIGFRDRVSLHVLANLNPTKLKMNALTFIDTQFSYYKELFLIEKHAGTLKTFRIGFKKKFSFWLSDPMISVLSMLKNLEMLDLSFMNEMDPLSFRWLENATTIKHLRIEMLQYFLDRSTIPPLLKQLSSNEHLENFELIMHLHKRPSPSVDYFTFASFFKFLERVVDAIRKNKNGKLKEVRISGTHIFLRKNSMMSALKTLNSIFFVPLSEINPRLLVNGVEVQKMARDIDYAEHTAIKDKYSRKFFLAA